MNFMPLLFAFVFSLNAYATTFLDDPSFDLQGSDAWSRWNNQEIKEYLLDEGGIRSVERYFALYPNIRTEEWGHHGIFTLRKLKIAEGLYFYIKAEMSFSRQCKAYLVNFKIKEDIYQAEKVIFDKTIILQDPTVWTEFAPSNSIYSQGRPLKLEIIYAPKNCSDPNPQEREFQIDYLQIGIDRVKLGGLGGGPKSESVK